MFTLTIQQIAGLSGIITCAVGGLCFHKNKTTGITTSIIGAAVVAGIAGPRAGLVILLVPLVIAAVIFGFQKITKIAQH